MDSSITAEWARKRSNELLGDKVTQELLKCEIAIKNAVKRNEMSCNVSMYAHTKTIQELNKRGFKVTQNNGIDQRETDYLTITW